MDRMMHFINKLWVFAASFHPLTYFILFIFSVLLFSFIQCTIQKFRPQTSKQNTVAATLTIFVGLPILGLILILLVGLYLKDQPF